MLPNSVALNTSRLIIKPYSAYMVTDQHVAWLNNKTTTRFSEQRHKTHTLESQHSYLNEFPHDSRVWLIASKTGHDIGTMTAYLDPANDVVDMGILIGEPSSWGKGYGYEAWDALIEFLFMVDVRKIEAGCMKQNTSMRNICGKAGMFQEAIIFNHFLLDNAPEALVRYGLMWYDMYQSNNR